MDDRIRADIEYRMGLWKTDDVSYNKEDVLQELESTSFRNWLDAGQSDQLFRNLRSLESRPLHPDRKMYTVMLAVMIMQSGARISDDNKQHLRDIAPRIPEYTVSRASKPQFEGFRHPGRVQFLAALEHHRPGTRRNFGAKRSVPGRLASVVKTGSDARDTDIRTSYYHCGKSEGDKFGFHCPCLICMAAWYCDQVGTSMDYGQLPSSLRS